MPTPEQLARENIDAMLTAAGWVIQDRRRINLHAAPAIALCETDVERGFADYGLFVDAKAIGVLEAKAEGTPLVGVADQSEAYARSMLTDFQRWAFPLPFTYESNGDEIRFRDLRDPRSRSRFLFTTHRPETLRAWIEQPDTLRARLQKPPPLITTGLRTCQVDAVNGLEKSFARQHPRALVQMATGAGKTWMAVTECYRLIKFGGAQRILFLVDRANLGKQAKNEFDVWHSPYTQRRFTDEYIVQRLDGISLEPRAKVVISTIQRLYSALTGKPIDDLDDERSTYEASGGDTDKPRPVAYTAKLPPETFDFIIIDECHRSIYNLWKGVLDYFDAFHIGLTATPSPDTLGFFDQNLVSSYTHEQAVLDKVNVGYDIYRIRTKLTEKGATVERGNHLEKIERRTRRRRWEKLKDDLSWTGRELDQSVVSPPQIRTVLTHFRDALFTKMFPQRSGEWIPKTLIYAKDDSHAERIVDIVRDVFGEGNDFCKKITYRSGGKKTTDDLIAEFRTSPALRIAVTVDMIATGTDIKPLEVVLFLRDVRSALYYEQMKGRGTRTIDPHELRTVTPDAKAKTYFVLVDAVGVTESLKSNTRPIERAPTVSFEKLLEKVARGNRTDATLSSLASRLLRLDGLLGPEDRERVRQQCAVLPVDLARPLGESIDPDLQVAEARREHKVRAKDVPTNKQLEATVRRLKETAVKPFHDPDFRKLLVELQTRSEVTVDHISTDAILKGTGYDAEKARGYIKNFEEFLRENRDKLLALQILYNRPRAKRHLTYDLIRELAEAMATSGYHLAPAEVWKCYARLRADRVKTLEPGEALTNLISLVRFATGQQAELASFPELARQKFQTWLVQQELASGKTFTAEQRNFLAHIAEEIGANAALTGPDLDHGTLKSRGGLPRALALFGKDNLTTLLEELNTALAA